MRFEAARGGGQFGESAPEAAVPATESPTYGWVPLELRNARNFGKCYTSDVHHLEANERLAWLNNAVLAASR